MTTKQIDTVYPPQSWDKDLDSPVFASFWEVADRLGEVLHGAGRDGIIPSVAARKAHTNTDVARVVLVWMVQHSHAQSDDRGAWTHYYAR